MSELDLLQVMLEQAYSKRTWHGPNLKHSLRGVSLEQALWRPSPERHNIWEYMLHCAYWKFVATSRILGVKRRFPRDFSDFPEVDSGSAATWKTDMAFLGKCHKELLEAVQSLKPDQLEQSQGRWQIREEIFGAANHDIYHAGQIQLLRRLQEAE